ncbi:hypothetical protein AB5J72_47605 [Streptomyces sp. CG1]|uniref:hypothetical protein n=1 Tax=Streptomyces sp. CG1 TaxID=1287523 RepID=UPI0034E19882
MSTGPSRQGCAITVPGSPTAVIDTGGLRIVSDPTFDEPGPHGCLAKTAGRAAVEDTVGPVDLVLVGHEAHPDNLDERGRAFAKTAPLVFPGPLDAERPGSPAVGFPLLAVPVHGPGDADGNVDCDVIGFVLSGQGLPTVYVTGDNVSIRTVAEISRRVRDIDAAVLHAGVIEHNADHVIALDAGLGFEGTDGPVLRPRARPVNGGPPARSRPLTTTAVYG